MLFGDVTRVRLPTRPVAAPKKDARLEVSYAFPLQTQTHRPNDYVSAGIKRTVSTKRRSASDREVAKDGASLARSPSSRASRTTPSRPKLSASPRNACKDSRAAMTSPAVKAACTAFAKRTKSSCNRSANGINTGLRGMSTPA